MSTLSVRPPSPYSGGPTLTPEGELSPQSFNFILTKEGMGGYICWLSAFRWIAETQPHVTAHLWSSAFFLPILREFVRTYAPPSWTAGDLARFTEDSDDMIPSVQPESSKQALGNCQLDYGFQTFAYLSPPPPGYGDYITLKPSVDLSRFELPPPGSYVVLTPCSTTKTRTQSPESWNGLKEYFLSRGTPVVLIGQTIFGGRITPVHPEYDLEGTLSLLNMTSLLEAQVIMSQARCVLGLDNGLIHLAATSEVPIVVGHNIASPQHRELRRKRGRHALVTPGIICEFCQSRLRFTPHHFGECIYKHYNCLKAMSAERWITAYEELQEELCQTSQLTQTPQ